MREINIGLLGCGTVGTGVARLLIQQKNLIRSRLGADLILKRIADIDATTDRGFSVDKDVWVADAFGVVEDPEIDIIVEMIGGDGIAKDLILKSISNGRQ